MNNLQVSAHGQNAELDLVEIIKVLWRGKLIVCLLALITTIMAAAYAFTAKEKWTSVSEVIPPRVIELGEYFNHRREYALITGETDVKDDALIKEIHSKFELLMDSADEREQFFTQSKVYKQFSEGMSELEKQEYLLELVLEDTVVVKPDLKKTPDAVVKKVQFTTQTPTLAQETLRELISYINTKTLALETQELLVVASEKMRALQYEKEIIEQNLGIQRIVQIQNLTKALDIAKGAGIKDYSSVLADGGIAISNIAASDAKIPLSESKISDGAYLFMLGERNLQAQLDAAKKEELIYTPRYYDIQEQLKRLEILLPKIQAVTKAQAFAYQASPSYPVKADWPKKAILLLLGLIFGGVLGCVIVLGRHVFALQK